MQDGDFVVCGYIYKENHIIGIVPDRYREEKLADNGNVTLGIGGEAFLATKNLPKLQRPPFDDPVPAGHGNVDAVWTKPKPVCVVESYARQKRRHAPAGL